MVLNPVSNVPFFFLTFPNSLSCSLEWLLSKCGALTDFRGHLVLVPCFCIFSFSCVLHRYIYLLLSGKGIIFPKLHAFLFFFFICLYLVLTFDWKLAYVYHQLDIVFFLRIKKALLPSFLSFFCISLACHRTSVNLDLSSGFPFFFHSLFFHSTY